MTASNEELCLPAVPDDDADFTPDLARKIIEKYQAIVSRLAAQSGGEVRVKPLEWVLDPDRQKDTPKWRAVDATGLSYEIFKAWWGHQQDWGFVALGEFHRTEEAAKAAAQADFERRIRSALVSPTSAPASVAAMKEALMSTVAHLAAAISLLERTTESKKAAPSNKMFDVMLSDYRKALVVGRDAIAAIDKIDVAASGPSDSVSEVLTWKIVDGEQTAFDRAGRKQFTIENHKGSRRYGLRRWSTRLDGTVVMGGIELCRSQAEAKGYAAALTASKNNTTPNLSTPTTDKIDITTSAPSDAVREAHTALAFAENRISKHIEEFHDFDYEPHQVPPELAQLRAIQHHLLGSLTGENGESVLREKNHLTASEGNAAPGVSQQTVAEGIARIIDPEAFEDHFAYQKAANMRKRALVATATANAILSAYPLRPPGHVSIPNDILMQARCPSDARQTIGECSNCGCSIGLFVKREGTK